jgi:hypothetical protein
MKHGTEEILAVLKRQRSIKLTRQHFEDLVFDVLGQTRAQFAEAAMKSIEAKQRAPRTKPKARLGQAPR